MEAVALGREGAGSQVGEEARVEVGAKEEKVGTVGTAGRGAGGMAAGALVALRSRQ